MQLLILEKSIFIFFGIKVKQSEEAEEISKIMQTNVKDGSTFHDVTVQQNGWVHLRVPVADSIINALEKRDCSPVRAQNCR